MFSREDVVFGMKNDITRTTNNRAVLGLRHHQCQTSHPMYAQRYVYRLDMLGARTS